MDGDGRRPPASIRGLNPARNFGKSFFGVRGGYVSEGENTLGRAGGGDGVSNVYLKEKKGEEGNG